MVSLLEGSSRTVLGLQQNKPVVTSDVEQLCLCGTLGAKVWYG